jgi:hypothetical protein
MASVVEIACPECEENLKIPPSVFGKKVKCKHCGHAFVVKDPAAKPGAKPVAATPPPEAKPKSPFLDDDDDEGAKKVELVTEDEVPRCPHCAKELDPPDAVVCIHCGFNNRTRAKRETKRVWAPSVEDWAKHLFPGILAAVIIISLLVWNIVCFMTMREWMTGSFLEMDETDAAGRKKFFVPPGFFICLSLVMSIAVIAPCLKFAYRRLYLEFTPPEQVKV